MADTNARRDTVTTVGMGFHTAKTAATLPQGTTQDIFVVTGGRVLVTLLLGEATVVFGAVGNDISVQSNPTTGTTLILASAIEGNAFEAGGLMVVEGDGTALGIVGKAGAGMITSGTGAWICPVGTIEFKCVGSTTGSSKWDIWYFPLDLGASVASAK